ncbi:MAG: tripartite tricarboxylate transporter substrate binding protein [Burkholderiales bacterium]|nr:tripartite tricarboxylate transporter substrate binding protein [Burkholderiales bacterium]
MKLIGQLFAAILCVGFAAAPLAQDYPRGPVKIIVPYPAGGYTDILGRMVGLGLQQRLGQPFVVENRPGAATALAAEIVANSPPDGHTLMMVTVTTMAMNPLTMKDLRYRPEQLAPVAMVARQPFMLVASLQFPPSSVRELIAHAKANPGKVNWATQGVAGSSHLVGELFKSLAGIDIFAVHYKGSAPANVDIMAGRADLHFDGVGTSLANVAAKRVKAVAITSERRMAANPDIPTFVEAGLADMVAYSWYGVVTPRGTPAPVIQRLNEEINRHTQGKETAERMARDGSEVGNMTPAQFGRMIADEAEMWKRVLLPLNIKLEP